MNKFISDDYTNLTKQVTVQADPMNRFIRILMNRFMRILMNRFISVQPVH